MKDLEEIKNDLEKLLINLGDIVEKDFENKNKEFSSKINENDLLTKTDTDVNEKIISHLESNYPEVSIVSEESDKIEKDSEYAFVIDPIDGTRNFVRNIPIFHIGIGLVKDNKTILCITYNPISKEMFWAIKGKGSFVNNVRLKVCKRDLRLSDIIVRVLKDRELEKEIALNTMSRIPFRHIKNNMCCHDEISGISYGRLDGLILGDSSVWDYCQYLLIKEAGGKVTDWEGNEFDISKDKMVASNGIIHEELLDIVKNKK